MKTIHSELKLENLEKLFETDWFNKTLSAWRGRYEQLTEIAGSSPHSVEELLSTPFEKRNVDDYLALIKFGSCWDYHDYPLIFSAIDTDDANFVMAAIVAGANVNAENDEELPAIVHAMQGEDDIFHLLLLVPEIHVTVEYQEEDDLSEVSEFCGYGVMYNYYRPAKYLLSPNYFHILKYINVDWDCVYSSNNKTLFVICLESYDFDGMSMLSALGADFNYRDIYDDNFTCGYAVFAIEAYLHKPTEKNKMRMEWFTRHINLLSEPTLDNDLAIDNIIEIYNGSSKLKEFINIDYYTDTKKLKAIANQKQSISPLHIKEDVKPVSIASDLQRVFNLILHKSIKDICVTQCQGEWGIEVISSEFVTPYLISLPQYELAERLKVELEELKGFTALQFIIALLGSDVANIAWINFKIKIQQFEFFDFGNSMTVWGSNRIYNSLIKNPEILHELSNRQEVINGDFERLDELTKRFNTLIDKPPLDICEFKDVLDVLVSDVENSGLMEILKPNFIVASELFTKLLNQESDTNVANNSITGGELDLLTNQLQALIDNPPKNSEDFDRELDDLEYEIEGAGFMEVLEPKLNEAADLLTKLLFSKGN